MRLLALLLLITNATSLGLHLPDFAKIKPNSPSTERIGIRLPTILFKSSTETADESIKTTPSLPQRARTRRRRVRVTKERTHRSVNFSLAELIKITEEFKNVSATTTGE